MNTRESSALRRWSWVIWAFAWAYIAFCGWALINAAAFLISPAGLGLAAMLAGMFFAVIAVLVLCARVPAVITPVLILLVALGALFFGSAALRVMSDDPVTFWSGAAIWLGAGALLLSEMRRESRRRAAIEAAREQHIADCKAKGIDPFF